MKIYGAGMAGLIAGHMFRRFEPEIHEIQPELPNNHEAVLRFRSEAVSIATGIPFRRVRVYKQVMYKSEVYVGEVMPPKINNQYSLKVTGQVLNRSIVNLDPVDRWIAPVDFVDQLSNGLDIRYSSSLNIDRLDKEEIKISTIPMPVLVKYFDTPGCFTSILNFAFKPTWNVVVDFASPQIDVHQTTYFPESKYPYYRATLTGSRLIIEYIEEPKDMPSDTHEVMSALGIPRYVAREYRKQRMEYGKIVPVDSAARKQIIRHATEKYQCYSLGRFATWRQILLDDIVNDIKVIEQLINADSYTRALVEAT